MIPLIETGGSPYEAGFDVGRAVRNQIEIALESTIRHFVTVGDPDALLRVAPFAANTTEAYPWLAEEIRGTADGANRSFEEILFLNATAELDQLAGRLSECTVAGTTQAGIANGHVLVAHLRSQRSTASSSI